MDNLFDLLKSSWSMGWSSVHSRVPSVSESHGKVFRHGIVMENKKKSKSWKSKNFTLNGVQNIFSDMEFPELSYHEFPVKIGENPKWRKGHGKS